MPGKQERIRKRLERASIPFDDPAPDGGGLPLEPFVEQLGSRTILGLGESAHGTSEFPRLKHSIVRHCVEELNFDVLTLEKPFPEVLALNDYVLGRTDDLPTAYASFRDDPWMGRKWLSVMEWLRTYNDETTRGSIPVYGFTKTYSGRPATLLSDFFKRADASLPDELWESLDLLQEGLFDEAAWTVHNDRLQMASDVLPTLRDHLMTYREQYTEATSETDWTVASQLVRILEQVCDLQATLDDPDQSHRGLRDRFMAENIEWICDHVGIEGVVVSAANSHIQDSPSAFSSLDVPPLGSYLRDRHGDAYYALACDFGSGKVRARRPATDGEGLELDEFELPPPHEMMRFDRDLDSWGKFTEGDLADPQLHAVIEDCEFETAILDFDILLNDDVLREWLEDPHLLHGVGSRHWPSVPERSVGAHVLPEEFDGLLITDEVHPPSEPAI